MLSLHGGLYIVENLLPHPAAWGFKAIEQDPLTIDWLLPLKGDNSVIYYTPA